MPRITHQLSLDVDSFPKNLKIGSSTLIILKKKKNWVAARCLLGMSKWQTNVIQQATPCFLNCHTQGGSYYLKKNRYHTVLSNACVLTINATLPFSSIIISLNPAP